MEVTLKDVVLSGVDSVTVLYFLVQIVDEANTLKISETQALIALPYFLTGDSATQFKSVRSESGVFTWLVALKFFL